jgi:syntaxin 18
MDITTDFSDYLSQRDHHRVEPVVFDLSNSKINEFLREAYRINSHITELTNYLRSIRGAYLALQSHRPRARHNALHDSTSSLPAADKNQPLTDQDREKIDVETRYLLTTISSAVRQLSETAKLSSDLDASLAQQRRSKKGLGLLGRWAAGGGVESKSPEELEEEAAFETIKMHRDGVIWYLQRRLEIAAEKQRSMTEIRVQREVEKHRSILYKAKGLDDGIGVSSGGYGSGGESWNASTSSSVGVDMDREEYERQQRQAMETMLTPEQVQMFEREQQDMVKQFNENLQKIRLAFLTTSPFTSIRTLTIIADQQSPL